MVRQHDEPPNEVRLHLTASLLVLASHTVATPCVLRLAFLRPLRKTSVNYEVKISAAKKNC